MIEAILVGVVIVFVLHGIDIIRLTWEINHAIPSRPSRRPIG
jgi:hypothetical protein